MNASEDLLRYFYDAVHRGNEKEIGYALQIVEHYIATGENILNRDTEDSLDLEDYESEFINLELKDSSTNEEEGEQLFGADLELEEFLENEERSLV